MLAIARDRFGEGLQVSIAKPGVVAPEAVDIENPAIQQWHAGIPAAGMRSVDSPVFVDVVHLPEHRMRNHNEYVARPLAAIVARRNSIEDISVQDARGMEERLQTDYVFYRGVATLPPIQEPMRVDASVVIYL